jgi:hypothetical protein
MTTMVNQPVPCILANQRLEFQDYVSLVMTVMKLDNMILYTSWIFLAPATLYQPVMACIFGWLLHSGDQEHVGTMSMTIHSQLGDLEHEVRWWTDKLFYLSPTSDFSSDISSDILLKTKLQTFSSEVTRGNKTSDETSDIWPMIPWRTSEYSSDFLFLSLFRQLKRILQTFIQTHYI